MKIRIEVTDKQVGLLKIVGNSCFGDEKDELGMIDIDGQVILPESAESYSGVDLFLRVLESEDKPSEELIIGVFGVVRAGDILIFPSGCFTTLNKREDPSLLGCSFCLRRRDREV